MILSKIKKSLLNNYQYFEHYVNLKTAFFLVALAIAVSTIGFLVIEDYSFIDAFYMSIITLSTVGFTEAQPLSDNGRLFVSIMIMFNIGIYAYSISAFTQFIIHGELFKMLHMSAIEKDVKKLKEHVIVCGYGKYGKEIASQFIKKEIPFIVIDKSESEIESLQDEACKLLFIHNDATHDEVLVEAGIENAKALISALPEDADNVFTVLTARQLNANINIISRAVNPKTEKKLIMAGANHVILPAQIGGFHMASLVSNPTAVDFFSSLVKGAENSIQIESIKGNLFQNEYQGKALSELDIRQQSGANLIALKTNDEYMINPSSDHKINREEAFILLGSNEQMDTFRSLFLI